MHEQPLTDVDLPIIRELGEALYTAALAVDGTSSIRASRVGSRTRRSSSRAKRRHDLRHPPLLVIVALSIVILLAGIAAAGSLVGGVGITPEQWLSGSRATQPTAITASQSAHLAILRRGRHSVWDSVDPKDVDRLSHGTFSQAAGGDFALSRRVRGLASGAAWIVPGAGRVCLIAYSALDGLGRRVVGGQGGAECSPTVAANRGSLTLFAPVIGRKDAEFVAGVVPDGVFSVSAVLNTGAKLSLPVHENVYLAHVPHAVIGLSFLTGRLRVKLGPFRAVPLRLRLGTCGRNTLDEVCRG